MCIWLSPDVIGSNVMEETWSVNSVPLTNEFRYNMSESLPFVPQNPSSRYDGYVSNFFLLAFFSPN